MNSPTHAVCEGLKIFGFQGFQERTEAYRFNQDKLLNFDDRDLHYWIIHGKHLPRPKSRRGIGSGTKTAPKTKRQKVKINKRLAERLLDL